MEVLGLTPEDAIEYIQKGARVSDFKKYCTVQKLRLGQAWFSSLSHDDRQKLTGRAWDPYYRDTWQPILVALAYLLDPNIERLDLVAALNGWDSKV